LLPIKAITLSYGGATKHLSSNEISSFCSELADINADGSWTALDILFMYCHGTNKFLENKSAFKKIVLSVSLNKKLRSGHSDTFQWKKVVNNLLETEGVEFSKNICQKIIAAASDLDYGDIHDTIKPILIEIMSNYGKELWPLFSQEIINSNSIKRYKLKSLLGREIGFGSRRSKDNIFSVLPLELTIDWSKQYKKIAPSFVASSINIFEQTDNAKQPSKLFIALLENFGDLETLKDELSSNLNTGGWSGSRVPYLESDKAALEPLLNHSNQYVRNWTKEYIASVNKQIEYETMRDQEHDLGIY
jgi:hypothetical protein